MNDHAIADGLARDALAAVLEAINIPHAATVGEQRKRKRSWPSGPVTPW
jgi:hypothetical protein